MKQNEIIRIMKSDVFPKCDGLNAALLIGSCANGKMTSKSDIDWSLWVDEYIFSAKVLADVIKRRISDVKKTIVVELRGKIVVYFENCPKMELLIFNNIDGLNRHFLGSEISDIADSIAFVKSNLHQSLENHLKKINTEKQSEDIDVQRKRIVRELADKFVYEFENASAMHKRSDSYKFYFGYNIVLHVAVQLEYISSGTLSHYYLPKQFSQQLSKDAQDCFRKMNGTLYLPEANEKKRRLLDFFYSSIQKLGVHSVAEIYEMETFLECVYERDYLWNFRDSADFNPCIRRGKIFRSSCFARYQHDSIFARLIRKCGITAIVDLREDKECRELSYEDGILAEVGVKYVRIPVDINQADGFKDSWREESLRTVEYRWFALGNKRVYCSFFTEIDPKKDSVIIHCHAGKDRTGAFVALLAMLAGEAEENIEADYLESGMDSDIVCIRAFIDSIKSEGGAEKFLYSCGVDKERVSLWKQELKSGKAE